MRHNKIVWYKKYHIKRCFRDLVNQISFFPKIQTSTNNSKNLQKEKQTCKLLSVQMKISRLTKWKSAWKVCCIRASSGSGFNRRCWNGIQRQAMLWRHNCYYECIWYFDTRKSDQKTAKRCQRRGNHVQSLLEVTVVWHIKHGNTARERLTPRSTGKDLRIKLGIEGIKGIKDMEIEFSDYGLGDAAGCTWANLLDLFFSFCILWVWSLTCTLSLLCCFCSFVRRVFSIYITDILSFVIGYSFCWNY